MPTTSLAAVGDGSVFLRFGLLVLGVVTAPLALFWLAHRSGLRDVRTNPRLLVARDEQATALRYQALNASPPSGPLLADAIFQHRYNLRLSERVLGADHPGTWGSRASLARDYLAARDPRAIELFEQLVAYQERVDGPDRRDTLRARDELADAYQTVGRHDEAVAIYERILADTERSQSVSVRNDVDACRANLIAAYELAGRHEDAAALWDRVVEADVSGRTASWMLAARDETAQAHAHLGRADRAIVLYGPIIADSERLLGPDAPRTLAYRRSLARACRLVGRIDQAVTLYEALLADWQRVAGPDQQATVTARKDLAAAYRSAGRTEDAAALTEPDQVD